MTKSEFHMITQYGNWTAVKRGGPSNRRRWHPAESFVRANLLVPLVRVIEGTVRNDLWYNVWVDLR